MTLGGMYNLLLRGLSASTDPRQLHHMTPEAAYQELKQRTGQDFGYDVEKWRAYLRANREQLRIPSFDRV